MDAMSESLKVEYHPMSGITTKIVPFTDGTLSLHADIHADINQSSHPWAPFMTKADFEFAELVTQDNSAIHSIETHIKIHQLSPQPAITFTTYKDFDETLKKAATLLTDVRS